MFLWRCPNCRTETPNISDWEVKKCVFCGNDGPFDKNSRPLEMRNMDGSYPICYTCYGAVLERMGFTRYTLEVVQ